MKIREFSMTLQDICKLKKIFVYVLLFFEQICLLCDSLKKKTVMMFLSTI